MLHRYDGYGDLERDAQERLFTLLTETGAKAKGDVLSFIRALDLDEPHPHGSPKAELLRQACGDDFVLDPCKPIHDRNAEAEQTPRALLEAQLLTLLGIPESARAQMAPRPLRPLAWQRLVAACQTLVQARVLEKGLVIEINPSSNRMVGGFASLARLPYTRVSKPGPRQPGQPANMPLAIGTDDAGIFHTSLRREYEIVGKAALEQGYALPDVHQWLDDLRRTARRASFFGRERPKGKALIKELDRLLGAEELPNAGEAQMAGLRKLPFTGLPD